MSKMPLNLMDVSIYTTNLGFFDSDVYIVVKGHLYYNIIT